jgi:peptidoglycan/LPS O-acetylase OafA/YrhL
MSAIVTLIAGHVVTHKSAGMGEIPARLEFLDALRGIAAAWVALFHIYLQLAKIFPSPQWAWILSFGGIGVMLFFVVSAFSLCYTMRLYTDKSAAAFYTRRFFRIAPLFYVMILFQCWFSIIMIGYVHGPAEILSNITFLFNLVPGHQDSIVWGGWTVGAEVMFYVIFPFLYRYIDNVWKALALVIASLLIARMTPLLIQTAAMSSPHFFVRLLPVFSMGILAFHISALIGGLSHRRAIGAGMIGLSMLLLTLLFRDSNAVWWYNEQGVVFAILLVGLMYVPLSIFVNCITRFLGTISYSLYLTHLPLLFLVHPVYRWLCGLPLRDTWKFVACVAITIVVLVPLSCLTYWLIERPGIDFGRRLIVRRAAARHAWALSAQDRRFI